MNLPAAARSGPFALGCNSIGHIDAEGTDRLISAALDRGITHFDTAAAYASGSSEAELGRVLPADRSGLFVATKVGHPASVPEGEGALAPQRLREAVDRSRARLRVDCLDLCYLHFPDPVTPLEEVLETIAELIREGKIAAYGLSNFSVTQMEILFAVAGRMGMARPVALQGEYNLINRSAEQDLLPFARKYEISFFPFFPLSSGLLSGGYRNGEIPGSSLRSTVVRGFEQRFITDVKLAKLARIQALCDRAGVPIRQAALQWVACHSDICLPLVGASSARQVIENVDALALPADPELMVRLDESTRDQGRHP